MQGTIKEVLYQLRKDYEQTLKNYESIILNMADELEKKDAEKSKPKEEKKK